MIRKVSFGSRSAAIAGIALTLLTLASCNAVLGLGGFKNQCGGDVDESCTPGQGGASSSSSGIASASGGNASTSSGSGGAGNAGGSGGSGGVECHNSTECSMGTDCISASCTAMHTCATMNANPGTPCSDHDGQVCDGNGSCVQCNTIADCAATGTLCVTLDSCTANECKTTNAAPQTACHDHGGNQCDSNGNCIGAINVGAGGAHTCAVTNIGGVKCWGSNSQGQLGDGTMTDRAIPTDVMGLTSGAAAVVGGGAHSCALTTAGGVKCWGDNSSGQLGNGTTTSSLTPVDVMGLTSGVQAITTGAATTCALTTAGGVKCWGSNQLGTVGDGTGVSRNAPVDVSGLTSGISAISGGGGYHICALTTGNTVMCWGYNTAGAIGDNTTTQRNAPVAVLGNLFSVATIGAGQLHTCAVRSSGSVFCWGDNSTGEIGDGTTTQRLIPTQVPGVTASFVAGGYGSSCVIDATNGMECWGAGDFGQLGNGAMVDHHSPVAVSGISNAQVPATAGQDHVCVLVPNGGVKCWGDNANNQLGDGTAFDRSTPVDVLDL